MTCTQSRYPERQVDGLATATFKDTSYDGTLIWEIRDFSHHLTYYRATDTYIDSPPFYTSRHGYKLRARLYPNNPQSGVGANLHMGIYIYAVKGENDELLDWPFQDSITFKLIDQTGESHESKTLPSVVINREYADNVGKSKKEGILKFIRHDKLRNTATNRYIKDNTMIIHVLVGMNEL